MANLKLSPTMKFAMLNAGEHRTGYAGGIPTNTLGALMARGLVNLAPTSQIREIGTHVVSVAGWDWLKAEYGIERPADEGRMTLEEAWDDAIVFRVAALPSERISIGGQDAGRMTLEEAFADAYTPMGQVTCKHGRGLADTCDHCPGDSVLIDTTGVDVTGLAAVLSEANRITSEHDAARIREAESFQRSGRGHVAGQAYDREVLNSSPGRVSADGTTVFSDDGEPMVYRGVRVPPAIAYDWFRLPADAWRSGIRDAQEAARETVSRALPPIGAPAFECPVCLWKFTTLKSLTRHQEVHVFFRPQQSQTVAPPFECPVCLWKFTSAGVRDSHREGHRK